MESRILPLKSLISAAEILGSGADCILLAGAEMLSSGPDIVSFWC